MPVRSPLVQPSYPLLEARLFGQVSLAVDERPLPEESWPPRGGRELLLILLSVPGHRLTRDEILDALWPHLSPESARNAYYKALHSLRRTLEPDLASRQEGSFLRASADSLALASGTFKVDVDRFEQMLAAGNAAADAEQAVILQAALPLYCGDFLAGDLNFGWASGRREQLRLAWQRALLRLATLELAAQTYDVVIERTNLVLAGDPTNEEAHRLLIEAYDQAGQRDLALRQYERCVAILRDELGIAPSALTSRAATNVLRLPMSVADPPRRVTAWLALPIPPNRLIGRDAELEAITESLLQGGVRLVTLIGPGGVGKTRLAIEAAGHLAPEFADGVTFVSLATIRDQALVPSAIMHALGLRQEAATSPLEQLQAVLRARSTLLVLDNFEQILPAASLVADILAACPGVRFLVTSREPLHLRSEHLRTVPPLAVPPISHAIGNPHLLASLARSDAVALFLERARAVEPELPFTETNALAIAGICERLDGLPLAIELAAARSREFTPPRLLQLLNDRLDILVDGYRDLPARQQTMRNTIAWSYDLLDPDLQALFRRMAVFASGCTPEIAALVTGGSSGDGATQLQSLVQKSLAQPRADGSGYVGMLETTRAFGLERLAATDEAELAHSLLLTYSAALTTEAIDHLAGREQGIWLDRLDAEHETLREALSSSIDRSDATSALMLAGNLWRYWWSRGYLGEGRAWLEQALHLAGESEPARRALALGGAASLAESQGDFAQAVLLHEQALALCQAERDLRGEARAWGGLGTAAAHRGDFAQARHHHDRALQLARAAQDRPGMARTLDRLGTLAGHEGNPGAAEAAYAESLALFRELGDLVNASIVLSNLGEILHRHGASARAAGYFEEALRLERELDLPDGMAFDLMNLARVRLDLGELDHAASLIGQGTRLFRDMGNQLGLANALGVQATVCRLQGDPHRARNLLAESLGILAELGEHTVIPEHLEQLAAVETARGNIVFALRLLGVAETMREDLGVPPALSDRNVIESTLQAASLAFAAAQVADQLAQGRTVRLTDVLTAVANG